MIIGLSLWWPYFEPCWSFLRLVAQIFKVEDCLRIAEVWDGDVRLGNM